MRDRIRCWLKLTAVLLIGMIMYSAANPSPEIEELVFAYKALFVSIFGTPAQRESLTDEAGRLTAAQSGDLELFEARKAFREAIDAQHRLAELNEGLADYAVEVAIQDRDARQAAKAEDYP
jgi:hypothetical protein